MQQHNEHFVHTSLACALSLAPGSFLELRDVELMSYTLGTQQDGSSLGAKLVLDFLVRTSGGIYTRRENSCLPSRQLREEGCTYLHWMVGGRVKQWYSYAAFSIQHAWSY